MILQRSVKYILWLHNWSLQESIPAVMQNKDGPKMANSLLTVESEGIDFGHSWQFLERKEKEQEEKAKQERKKFKTNETSGPM